MQKVNLAEKFARFSDTWSPKIVGEVNGVEVRLARLRGEFIWHHHEREDELFLIVKGRLRIRLRDGDVELNEGEFFIVPAGVEHMPVADEECQVFVLTPKTTLNTGTEVNERTVTRMQRL